MPAASNAGSDIFLNYAKQSLVIQVSLSAVGQSSKKNQIAGIRCGNTEDFVKKKRRTEQRPNRYNGMLVRVRWKAFSPTGARRPSSHFLYL